MTEENEQVDLNFPSFDEIPDEEAQAQVPDDSFDAASVTEDESGCCVA